ncbi:MAG: Spy/CpxP family protein refolding chaperone [Pseudolabrys sp.]|nr:Spy/CpxP family protein refolding chaperone [Pseudolabrys sp.]
MTRIRWAFAAAITAAMALSTAAGAQDPKKAAPAAKPAPAARPAPPPAAARPAPAPHIAAPPRPAAPAPHIAAPPHPAPHIAAPSRPTPHFAAPSRPAPHIAAPRQPSASPRIVNRPQPPSAANKAAATPLINRATTPQNQAAGASPRVIQAPPLNRVERRQERLAERAALRGVPRSQRAGKLQEFRAQRAAQRQQQFNPQAAPNALSRTTSAPNALQANTTLRRNGQPRINAQTAQQGRFAGKWAAGRAGLAANTSPTTATAANRNLAFVSARNAWRQGRRAGFRAWFGPIFYPYAYSDIFDYTFWPYGYDEGYWDYAYDDFFDGVFYGTAPVDYSYGYGGGYGGGGSPLPPGVEQTPSYAAVQQLCKQPGNGVTAWPIAEISQKIGLNGEQKNLLDELKAAGQRAAQAFAASCPTEANYPMTPPGRLAAMTARLDATLNAVNTVKPALDAFYNSLNDEQKERFNELGPAKNAAKTETTAAAVNDKNSCGEAKPGLTNLPIERIEDAVKPNDRQADALKALEDATNAAVSKLAAACPDEVPLTPPGRLDAMGQRLAAMIDAANTVKAPLNNFYGSLNAEQKARFNAIGRQLAANDQQ